MTKKTDLSTRLYQLVDELQDQGLTLNQARKEFEKQFIKAALRANGGNVSRSARSLGVHRNTLHNKVSDFGIGLRDTRRRDPDRSR